MWSVAISDNAEDLMDPIPHESENLTADGKIFSIQWSFNEIGSRILLKLLSGRVYLCEIYVHAVSSECLSVFHLKSTIVLRWRLMKHLFLTEDDGGENKPSKKRAKERSVNGNLDYGKKAAKETENGTNKIPLWAFAFGISVIFSISVYCYRKIKISGKNRRR
jgi:hypothetical protein